MNNIYADRYVRTDLAKGGVRYVRSNFNGDGKQDLLLTTLGSFLYLNKNDGTFQTDTSLPIVPARTTHVEVLCA